MQIQITPFGGGDSSVSVMADQPFNNDQYHIATARTTSDSYHVVCGENLNSEDPSERVARICASHGDVFFVGMVVENIGPSVQAQTDNE